MKFSFLSITFFFVFLQTVTSSNNDLQDFHKWFVKNGGIVNGLDIYNFPDMGRGLIAIKNISRGEKVLFIPKKLILSSNLVKTSSDLIHRKLFESFPQDNELMIALVLLEKIRGKDSFWSPYIKVLPKHVPNLAQYDREELELLQSPTFSDGVMANWHHTIQSYNEFLEKVKSYWPSNPKLVTLQDYMWASSIIDSRGFRFKGEINLAPFSDMFNYSPHPDPRPSNGGNFFLEHHILNTNGLDVLADRDCSTGLQLFEDYGDNSDQIYLQYHGFMPEQNPFRCIQISTDPLDHPSIPSNKQKLLKEFRFKRAPSKCVDQTGDLGQMMIAYIALLSLNEEEEYRCWETINSEWNQWQRVSQACGILHTTNFLSTLLKSTPSNIQSHLDYRQGSLDQRVHQRILALFTNNTQSFTPTTMRTDYYLILEAKSQLKQLAEQASDNSNQILKLIKRINALSYRYFTKEHLWNLCFKYGSTCNLSSPPPRPLTPIALEETCSSDNEMTCSIPQGDNKMTKVTLYDIWNQTSQQKDQNLETYLNEFNKWFNSHIHPPARNTLLAKLIPGFRIGTITTETLELDEVYLAIPPTLVMDSLSAEKDRKIGNLLHNLLRVYNRRDDYHGLIFHLLYESLSYGSESQYWNYLRLLPTPKEMDIPLFWSEEEISSRLGPSSLKDEMLEYKFRVKKNYEMLAKVPLLLELISTNVLTEESYTWASAILDSRSIWWNGQRHLVPMLDFINCQERMGERNEVIRIHSTKVERFSMNIDEVEVNEGDPKLTTEAVLAATRAAWPFQMNEQLFENYGQPNHIYFAYHGFILDSNSNDCVQFRIVITEEESNRIDVMKAKHVFEYLRFSTSKPIPPTALCLSSKMTFEEIPQRVWVYLSLKANQYGTSERDLIMKPTTQGKNMFINLVKEHAMKYLNHENKNHPHMLAQRFLKSEQDILEKWLAGHSEQK